MQSGELYRSSWRFIDVQSSVGWRILEISIQGGQVVLSSRRASWYRGFLGHTVTQEKMQRMMSEVLFFLSFLCRWRRSEEKTVFHWKKGKLFVVNLLRDRCGVFLHTSVMYCTLTVRNPSWKGVKRHRNWPTLSYFKHQPEKVTHTCSSFCERVSTVIWSSRKVFTCSWVHEWHLGIDFPLRHIVINKTPDQHRDCIILKCHL